MTIGAMPPWIRIVFYYPGLRVGPTLPFVLGACRSPVGTAPPTRGIGETELCRLLSAMSEEMPTGYGVNIQWCPETEAYVAARASSNALTWAPEIDAHNIETLAGFLWGKYGDQIAAGTFSVQDKTWHAFAERELELIEATLKMPMR